MAEDVTILHDVKKAVGVIDSYTIFDAELLLLINTAISTLTQIGLGPGTGVVVTENDEWSILIGDRTDLEMVKTYVGYKTRMLFDPPASSALSEAFTSSINELLWRIQNAIEFPIEEV